MSSTRSPSPKKAFSQELNESYSVSCPYTVGVIKYTLRVDKPGVVQVHLQTLIVFTRDSLFSYRYNLIDFDLVPQSQQIFHVLTATLELSWDVQFIIISGNDVGDMANVSDLWMHGSYIRNIDLSLDIGVLCEQQWCMYKWLHCHLLVLHILLPSKIS